ncbi:MAG: hypothetical protein QS748_11020 [Candidatus Endonucleobacter bathymodioli]|uniref:DAGKc domain-containing protein n=1 Tax=Candidatus Endonucleibacter bathymodioli TaxID=539814 RepID=A0AA90SYG4_9GAMM|nr:hypothetical protein [Candidatus Endonucleobacter bathymodioli]
MLYNIQLKLSICKPLSLFLIILYAANLYADDEIIFIVNPTSGGDTCGKTLALSVKRKWLEETSHRITNDCKLLGSLMDDEHIKLNNDNMTTIVSVGGNGTFNQIARTLFQKFLRLF